MYYLFIDEKLLKDLATIRSRTRRRARSVIFPINLYQNKLFFFLVFFISNLLDDADLPVEFVDGYIQVCIKKIICINIYSKT